jgi:hypothetical protein
MRLRVGLLASLLIVVLIAASYSTALLSPSTQPAAQVGTPSALCANLVDQAVLAVGALCGNLGRNLACYGNRTVAVNFRPDSNLVFDQSGDIVDLLAIQRLSTAPLDPATNDWGIAVLKAQANLPGTLPGQNVTFVLFGDTTTDNPSPDMRAVTINTRIGDPACVGAPNSAVLIQSPQGAQVEMTINGADVTLGSTAFVTAVQNQFMTISIVEGTGIITAFGKTVVVVPGAQVRIPLGGADGLQVIGPPSDPEPFDFDAINLSPLTLLPDAVIVPQPIGIVQPTTAGCVPRADWTFRYTVPFGDTLSGIAQRIGMSTAALAEGNCITNANILSAGQVIRAPREVPFFVFRPTKENPFCGDDVCEMGENTDSCAADCAPDPVCGNHVCEIGEDGETCAVDCVPTGPYCGDGTCDPGEDSDSCAADCPLAPWCGDGTCNGTEDSSTCSVDCGSPLT